MAAPPQLDLPQAKAALADALAAFNEPTNKAKLQKIIEGVNAMPEEQRMMAKMMQLLPVVTEIQASTLSKYGFPPGALMMAAMQIQAMAPQDPEMAAGCAELMAALQGNFSF